MRGSALDGLVHRARVTGGHFSAFSFPCTRLMKVLGFNTPARQMRVVLR